jgi:hypothetical protein
MNGAAPVSSREDMKLDPAPVDFVRGDATGLMIPAHGEALRAGGEDFLTRAFQAFGALAPDDRVARITRMELCPGGSTGQKFFLSVEYATPRPELHTELFVKFSRDFADQVRDDRGKHEMDGEIRLAALSRRAAFPVEVPGAYFADQHAESHTGVLITEAIAFGEGGLEPHHPKCLDHEMAEPIAHYRAIVKRLAWIAAAHRSGALAADIDALFPFDPEAAAARNRISYDAAQLRERVAQFADFAERCPQLFPTHVATPALFASLEREVGRFAEHQAAINRFQQSDPDFIALCHWNANIDNAWFWRDASGALQCGLMDWGHAGQLNLAFALWGCLSGAGLEIWDDHLEELLGLFIAELHAHGGPRLAVAELRLHLLLYVAMMGLSYFLDSPARILFRCPEAATASGPRDPVILRVETARNQLHISTVFLNLWRTYDVAAALDEVLARVKG